MARNTGQRENEAAAKWLTDKSQLFQVLHFSSVVRPEACVMTINQHWSNTANDLEIKHLIDKKSIISSSSLQA